MGPRETRQQRVVTSCRVEFERLDAKVVAESEDLSKRGAFVRTDALLPVGAVTELSIALPDGTEFRVIARVAHLLSPSSARALGRHTGMGFEFLEHDNQGRVELVTYLDQLIEEFTPPPSQVPTARRIVIVEPSTPLRNRLETALEAAGFALASFELATEAYAALIDAPPDLILTSADMPVMDGLSFVKMLTTHPRLARVPVVVTSEDSSDIRRLEAYRLGVRDYVHKPFTEEELVIRLHRLALARPAEAANERAMLRGHLGEISVATLLSLLEFERKSGILSVLHDAEIARLFVSSGRIVKVETSSDGVAPRDALFAVLDWNEGNFEFAGCEVVGYDEIDLSTSAILLEHARQQDERSA